MKNSIRTLVEELRGAWQAVREEKKYLLLIFAVVLLGNVCGIIGDHGLYLDDHFRYTFGTHRIFPWYIGKRNLVRPFILYPLFRIMAFSPYLARLTETLVFLAPLSCMVFLFFRRFLKLPVLLACTAAIIPAILPAQQGIPSFIDGSYTVQGLLFVLPCFFFGIRYAKTSNSIDAVMSVLFYVLGLGMMDHAVFMSLPFCVCFAVLAHRHGNKRIPALIIPVFGLAALKAALMILKPVTANKITHIPPAEIWNRFKLSFFNSDPFAFAVNQLLEAPNSVLGGALSVSLTLAAILFLLPRYRSRLPEQERSYPLYAAFGALWALSLSLPFIFASPDYSSRYLHIASYGSNLSILTGVYLLFTANDRRKGFGIFAILLVLLTGIARKNYLFHRFRPTNAYVQIMKEELNQHHFSENAQIAVIGRTAIPTGEYWHYSSGALQLYLNRKDVEGNIGREIFFYDPFQYPEGQAFEYKMNGFDLQKPIYLYRLQQKKLLPVEYALQWFEKTSEWKLHRFDLHSGARISTLAGQGRPALEKAIETKKIDRNGILWYKASN